MPGADARRMQEIEDYARDAMDGGTGSASSCGNGFDHVDRVRRWALCIARDEGFDDLALVEAAALLHDIGLGQAQERSQHAEVGQGMAAQFLRERRLFTDAEVEAIADAIRWHGLPRGGATLAAILRDADILDAVGAMGIMRVCTSKHAKPKYDPHNVRGDTWGLTDVGFDERFARKEGRGDYIVDELNFQISLYWNLRTDTARAIAQPLVEFMRAFIAQLESEVNAARTRTRAR